MDIFTNEALQARIQNEEVAKLSHCAEFTQNQNAEDRDKALMQQGAVNALSALWGEAYGPKLEVTIEDPENPEGPPDPPEDPPIA